MKLQPGDSGYHRMAWADALLEACTEADLTIKVPADFPVFAARLYETLGVATEIDSYPLNCSGCSKRVLRTGPVALWFEKGTDEVRRSWHFNRRPRRKDGRV